MTADDIVALMKKGNERFRVGKESPHDYLAQQKPNSKPSTELPEFAEAEASVAAQICSGLCSTQPGCG